MSRRKSSTQPKQSADDFDELPYIPPRPEEQLLIEHLAHLKADRILCTSHGRGQLAGFLASQNPQAQVTCHFLDSHFARLADDYWKDADDRPAVVCSPDLPPQAVDIVCIPVQRQGDAELTRDMLQQGYLRLKEGGTMYCAVNSTRDYWLHERLQTMFPKVTRIPGKRGVIYSGTRKGSLKKIRPFEATFSVPYPARSLTFQTRPGVFSHRRLDAGAWALIKAMEVKPGMQILDIGCGCGAVGIAAMSAANDVHLTAIDSNARAVEATRFNIEKNLTRDEQERTRVVQTHTGEFTQYDMFDLALANPPYFSNYKIARLFVETARKTLKNRGVLLIVTKTPRWFEEHLPEQFSRINTFPQGAYHIIRAVR